MPRITRGEFLGLSAALAGGFSVGRRTSGASSTVAAQTPASAIAAEPDLIVVNARVYTVDADNPRAEAFAIKNGRFVAVGSTRDVKHLATMRTRVIDAGQMTVTPGFIDTHCHVSGVNELYSVNANVRRVRELQANLRAKADKTPAGTWVSAVMFDDTGDLTGRVAELARGVFNSVGTRETFTPEQQRERGRSGMRHISELLTAAGLTSVHDAGADRDRILAYEDARAHGELRHRACFLVRGASVFEGFKAAGIYYGFGDEWIRVGGVKFAADGSASERTMRMSTPYVGTTDYGILTMTQQEIDEAVEDAHRHQFRVAVHANGDVTIDMVLKAYEKVLAKHPRPDARHRIEHCSLVNPDLLRRIKAIGAIPTPFWTYAHYHGEKWKAYGPEKMEWMFAHRSFLDSGIRVPGASDYGPGPFEPLMAIQSMVTRKDYTGRVWGPSQRITIDQALTVATINGAYASHEERVKGSITAGKLADFVMLEKDPHDVAPDTIKDITIARTVVGGTTMYPKSER